MPRVRGKPRPPGVVKDPTRRARPAPVGPLVNPLVGERAGARIVRPGPEPDLVAIVRRPVPALRRRRPRRPSLAGVEAVVRAVRLAGPVNHRPPNVVRRPVGAPKGSRWRHRPPVAVAPSAAAVPPRAPNNAAVGPGCRADLPVPVVSRRPPRCPRP